MSMTSANWPVGLCVAEGLANARASRGLSAIVVIVAAWISLALGLANAVETQSLYQSEQTWIEAGGFVMSVEVAGAEGSKIDVLRCESLNRFDGVAAFAVRTTTSALRPVNAPGTLTTLVETSASVFRFLGQPQPSGVGVVGGKPVQTAGLIPGSREAFIRESPGRKDRFWATVIESRSATLGPALEDVYLLPTLFRGVADSCRVKTQAGQFKAVTNYLRDTFPGPDGSPPIVRPAVAASPLSIDYQSAYQTRSLGGSWLPAALVLAAMWFLVQRLRRAQTAIYQTFGASGVARMLIQGTEWAALSLLGGSWGCGAALLMALGLGVEPQIAVTQVVGHTVAAWLLAAIVAIGIGILPGGRPLTALKERS